MTIETITAQLTRISADSYFSVFGSTIDLTIEDFIGFDEDWEEIFRDYEDEETLNEVLGWLAETADFVDGDLYRHYHFGEIVVEVGYSSFDI